MLKILREPFPFYLSNDRQNTWLAIGLAAFTVVLLTVLLPMEWFWFRKWLLIGGVIAVVLYSHIIWLPRLFPAVFDPERWTVAKYIGFTIWQLFVIGIIASLLVHAGGFHPELSLWENMYAYFINQLTYGSITVILATFVQRDVMLRTSLRNALHANRELERIRQLNQTPAVAGKSDTVTIQSDTSESVQVNPRDLIYIEAGDNYSTFYWRNGDIVEKKMLRMNLKSIESQLKDDNIIRCHRSYIVNINAITQVVGNTNGYKLSVRDTDFEVPVSRGKGRDVIGQLEQVRSIAGSA